jgi:hypothetical protein
MTEAEWRTSGIPVLSFESQIGWPSSRKQRLFAVACCRRILHASRLSWRDSLLVAEAYADKRKTGRELRDARERVPVVPVGRSTYASMFAQFGGNAVRWACTTQYRKFAGQVAECAATSAGYAALPQDEDYVAPARSLYAEEWRAANCTELAVQIALIDDVCGNPFRPVPFDPAWRTDTAVALARQMYDSREFSAMPILADALQDAGCEDEQVLNHCRDASQVHVRGCWVCDLVLNKN